MGITIERNQVGVAITLTSVETHVHVGHRSHQFSDVESVVSGKLFSTPTLTTQSPEVLPLIGIRWIGLGPGMIGCLERPIFA